jgi:hypothetical protein
MKGDTMGRFAVIGEYPVDYQDESFRSDVKVLSITDTMEQAQTERERLEREEFILLQIWNFQEY